MKYIDKYNNIKNKYQEYIVLIKIGTFYSTFYNDAIILNYLFNYKIINNKCGFPISTINKIKELIKEYKINYIIIEDIDNKKILETKKYNNNYYNKILDKSNKNKYNNNKESLLIERIKYLIKEDYNNFNKISEFINGL